ncbi:hydroxymethylglutaryl-CoA reductase, degradative [Labilibaculum sp. A4]|uniref:hydroxymethylglutaryl-CoA reductase, degradative n=1 Tax=Labilibaculum euxinus TaxID=2686357 RepID=UPI000F61C0C5|nr:hydroxymethylglutaryl-CoA reductase, degradative [Labilibaculum euxinus]MDQ1772620.1 hydroxymethylglutaryl-CoA reductase, degradative [Labilibaculum euxinus]MWN78391.1 hydroxymethylglutaryl-CoA reductase, degradative [Labilibaculum euxinus]
MKRKAIISGFSKLSREEKMEKMGELTGSAERIKSQLDSFRLQNKEQQDLLDEISENTLSNFYLPFGVAPNFLINNQLYHIPMVIEESSVIAAASRSAKFWASHGGFTARVVSVVKSGQVHFIWKGDSNKLNDLLPELKFDLYRATNELTGNMRQRGGGIQSIQLVNLSGEMENYYQLHVTFDTADSMGANFINSCLEKMAHQMKRFFKHYEGLSDVERECEVIMSILSNYTPDCLVECSVECSLDELDEIHPGLSGKEFAHKFQKASRIAELDVYRATTHNKGIFNGIDAVALATGNDFRAIEANGHVYASKTGKYKSLTQASVSHNRFRYQLTMPLSLGTVGGLTSLHPLAKFGLELLGKPSAKELMMITAAAGLANNFGALRSLVTTGIQQGHMKMHLSNLLNALKADYEEKKQALEYFAHKTVSYSEVEAFIKSLRTKLQ